MLGDCEDKRAARAWQHLVPSLHAANQRLVLGIAFVQNPCLPEQLHPVARFPPYIIRLSRTIYFSSKHEIRKHEC